MGQLSFTWSFRTTDSTPCPALPSPGHHNHLHGWRWVATMSRSQPVERKRKPAGGKLSSLRLNNGNSIYHFSLCPYWWQFYHMPDQTKREAWKCWLTWQKERINFVESQLKSQQLSFFFMSFTPQTSSYFQCNVTYPWVHQFWHCPLGKGWRPGMEGKE